MSSNVRGSTVRVQIDQKTVNRIIHAMREIEGSTEEFVLSRAATQTAREAQRLLSDRVKQVYEPHRSTEIKGRSSLEKAGVKKVTATVRFRSGIPGITEYKAPHNITKTVFASSGKKTRRFFWIKNFNGTGRPKGIFRMVGKQKKYIVKVSQRRDTGLQIIDGGFVTSFSNGHIDVVYRSKEASRSPEGWRRNRFPLKKALGSSDRAMVRNEDVYGKERQNIETYFIEDCERKLKLVIERSGRGKK